MNLATTRSLAISATALTLLLALFVAFAPDPAVSQAALSCPGATETVFTNMAACGLKSTPGCFCYRGPNPWYSVYWFGVPVVLGLLAASVLRTRWYLALAILVASVAVGGIGSLVVLHELGKIDSVQLVHSAPGVLTLALFAGSAWGVTRLLWVRITRRRSAGAA
jgi:hypothetical protein